VRQILSSLGFCLVIISAVFIAIGVVELIRGDSKSETSGLIGMVVLFVGFGIGGWKLVQANRSPSVPHLSKEQLREQSILDLAAAKRGRVTVAEVSAHCDLSLDDSKAELDRLAARRVAELEATEGGVLVYVFSGFLSDEEKDRARPL